MPKCQASTDDGQMFDRVHDLVPGGVINGQREASHRDLGELLLSAARLNRHHACHVHNPTKGCASRHVEQCQQEWILQSKVRKQRLVCEGHEHVTRVPYNHRRHDRC